MADTNTKVVVPVTIEYPETGERIGGEICPRGTMARLAAAMDMLRKVQWTFGYEVLKTCPFCHEIKQEGHAPGCELAALLGGEG